MRTRGGLQNGVFGAAVVCLVLLSSVAIAFLGNADNHDVQTTNWNYVTSANPAFTYDNAPARVEYSPPANYTGYSTDPENFDYMSGVTYTSSALPTAYNVKKEPVVTASGSPSYTNLHNNGVDSLGAQSSNLSNNNLSIGASVEDMATYSPAAILSAANLTSNTLWTYLIGAPLADHSIITFTSNDDNLFFALKGPMGLNWAGVVGDAYPKYYVLTNPQTYDKITVDADTDTVTLYSDDVSLSTAPLSDVIICYANTDGDQTENSLTNLKLDYTAVVWSRDYMNPEAGVSPIPDVSNYPSLTSAAALDPNTIYSSVDLSGEDIITTYRVQDGPNYTINLTLKVVLGGTIETTAYDTRGGGSAWIYAIKDFNWTATETGNYVLDITDSIAGFWEHSTKLHVEVVNPGTVYWSNGYDNAAVDLLVKSFNGSLAAGAVNVVCNSDNWTVRGVSVGTWPAMIISYDMDNGITARPVSSFNNFNSYTEAGPEIVISDSAFSPISIMAFYTTASVNMSVVKTTVYVENGGVYRVDSELDVAAKFPTYDTYNITISGASHWGDSITINGTTCAVDPAAGTVTISGEAFPLAGLVLAYSDNAFYYRGAQYEAGHLVAINGDLAADLGAAAGLVLEFDGTWYYETQLYAGAPGTISVIDWTPGELGLEPAAFSAVFTLLSLVGLVIASRLGGGTWDYLVLGSSVLVGFIMCGVFI